MARQTTRAKNGGHESLFLPSPNQRSLFRRALSTCAVRTASDFGERRDIDPVIWAAGALSNSPHTLSVLTIRLTTPRQSFTLQTMIVF